MKEEGYIPISRRLFEHPFWCEERTYSRFEAWLDVVRSARFEDTKQLIGNRFIEVKRGQMLVSLRFFGSRWQWSTKKVSSFLELLIQDKMITKETPKETGQTVITICNYDKYNRTFNEEETQKKQQGNSKETPWKHLGNKINKDNNYNELELNRKEIPSNEGTKKTLAEKLVAAKAATLSRKQKFGESLIPYTEQYGNVMIREFFDYWSELNKQETKMRVDKQDTWELPKRLATWAKKEKFDGKGIDKNKRDSEQRRIDSIVAVETTVRAAAEKKRAELKAEGVID
ncbi:MAG: hypothetical protein RSA44_03270 [Bacteroides sp.]